MSFFGQQNNQQSGSGFGGFGSNNSTNTGMSLMLQPPFEIHRIAHLISSCALCRTLENDLV